MFPVRQVEFFSRNSKGSRIQEGRVFCDNKQPDPNTKRNENKCAFLSNNINHAQKCIDLYEYWDFKWFPGRHDSKLLSWENRKNNLKEEYMKICTDKIK